MDGSDDVVIHAFTETVPLPKTAYWSGWLNGWRLNFLCEKSVMFAVVSRFDSFHAVGSLGTDTQWALLRPTNPPALRSSYHGCLVSVVSVSISFKLKIRLSKSFHKLSATADPHWHPSAQTPHKIHWKLPAVMNAIFCWRQTILLSSTFKSLHWSIVSYIL